MSTTYLDRFTGSVVADMGKQPVDAATTAPVTLGGYQTVDGVPLASDYMRVLVKNQTDHTDNGIYNVFSGAWTRTGDFNGPTGTVTGQMVAVNGGSQRGLWQLTTANPVQIDQSGGQSTSPSSIDFVFAFPIQGAAGYVDYLDSVGCVSASPVAYVTQIAKGQDSAIGIKAITKGTTTTAGQFYGATDISGKYFIQVNGVNSFEVTDTWWNPNTPIYQGAPTAWLVASSGALAGGPDNIAVLGVNSSIYDGATVTGATIMIATRGTTGALHCTSNGVVGHVNVNAIGNPNGRDTYNTAQSSLWFSGVASGAIGQPVISTQGTTGNGTLFYDAGTGGYEWKSDNTNTVMFKMFRTASGVNGGSITPSTAGNAITWGPYGTDTSIGQIFANKGTVQKNLNFYDAGALQLQVGGASTANTFLTLNGGLNTTSISAQGSSTGSLTIYTSSATGSVSIKTNNTATPVMDFLSSGLTKYTSAASFLANGTGTVTTGSLAPGTSSYVVKKWLQVVDNSGTTFSLALYGV